MWLLPIKVRAERSHLVLLPWRAGGILTPCLPNYIRLSFHYALAPVSDLPHLLCWTGQVMFVFWILRFLFVCFLFIFISWRLITLQYCSDFCHTLKWISHGFTCVPHPEPPLLPPSPSHPFGSSQCTSPEHLSHASNLGWWSVSPLIVISFQCYSLRSSHPHLLPQSCKVCSVHLCLFFCFAYWVIVTIF